MCALKLILFGPPRVEFHGKPLNITLRKALALLVYLAVTRQEHSRDTLATMFWPNDNQSKARGNLRRALSRLNTALDENQLDITRESVSISSKAVPAVDIDDFHSLLRECKAHGHPPGETCQDCMPLLEEAAATYTNDFLHGFSLSDCPEFDDWQFFQTEDLRRALGDTLERLVNGFSNSGDYITALPYAARWVALDPLHEPAQRKLMEMYALTGQDSAAMRQYQKCEHLLNEELGIPPGDETKALYDAILEKRFTVDSSADVSTLPPALQRAAPQHNLPTQITSFVGRRPEINAVKQLMGAARLLTLCGPPGTGKTRLAIEIAHQSLFLFPDGVFFVDLAPISDPRLVLSSIAQTLELKEIPSQPLMDTLTHHLHDKQILLLLDNFEQVIGAAPQVNELLSASHRLKVLVTSREALRVYGEQEYLVPPLSLPDSDRTHSLHEISQYEAVELFSQRTRAVKPDFNLTEDNAQSICEICVRLDGLPLAIELAAARSKLLSPKDICARLESRLMLLTSGARDLPTRSQTLRAAIDWSYELLASDERRLFNRLSVFQGGRTIEAVEKVADSDLSFTILDGLESLLDKNLLFAKEGKTGERRFYMLETIHEFARDMLAHSGEADELKRRHALYFVTLAERAEFELHRSQQEYWFARLWDEIDNIRTVVNWALDDGDVELGSRLVAALSDFWFTKGYFSEITLMIESIMESKVEQLPAVRAKLLNTKSRLASAFGEYKEGECLAREALSLAREINDKEISAWALCFLGSHLMASYDQIKEAFRFAEKGLGLFRELGHVPGIIYGLNLLGELSRLNGDYSHAGLLYQECLRLSKKTNNTQRYANCLANLSYVAYHQGNYDQAIDYCKRDLAILDIFQLGYLTAIALAMIAGPIGAKGDPESAARLLGASEAQLEAMDARVQPGDKVDIDKYKSAIERQLGESEYAKALAEGRAMTKKQALAMAVEWNLP